MKQYETKYLKGAIFLLVICCILGMATVSFAKFIDRFWYQEEGKQHGGHLDLVINTTPNMLDPHLATTGTGGRNNHFNGLIRVAPKMDGIELDLAESWEQLDDLTYKFVLRKGVKWQNLPPVNGRELTSADVKYSLRRMGGLEIPPPPKTAKEKKKKGRKLKFGSFKHNYYMTQLDKIETPDRYTVIIKTKVPFAPMLNYLGSAWAKIVPKEVVDEYGHFRNVNIGSGAYILKEFRRDSHILIEKNPDYFKKGQPYVDSIRTTIIADESARLAAFIARKLDWIIIPAHQRQTLMEQVPEGWFMESTTLYQAVLRMPPWDSGKGPLRKPWDDIRVRRAVVHAIDKDKMIQLTQQGFADKNVSCVPGTPGITLPQSDQPEYNPEKSKKLLAEAGYPNGFKTEIMCWAAADQQRQAEVAQAMLKEVGIDAELKVLEFGQYFRKAYTYNYDMAIHVMTSAIDPDELLAPYYGHLKTSTYYKWSDPVLWDMIEKQRLIMNPRKRAKYVQDVQRRVLDQAMNVFLFSWRWMGCRGPYFHSKSYLNDFQGSFADDTWIELDKQKAWKAGK
ncbi:MAG: ABC transporter substrate-binding protein [Desulfobacteraceae bacterium]|nr:ABC transporter substrate-binding protein [Desulfobacteraceae bacterium]